MLLVRFYWDCGRQGDLEGLFVTTRAELEKTYDRNVYFGEVLGKHSEVYGVVEENDYTIVTDDQDFMKKFVEYVGSGTVSGYNPMDYLDDDDDVDEEDNEDE